MSAFRYKATNSTGKILTGVVEADTPADAERRIASRGLKPLEVQAAVLPKPRRLVTEAPKRRVWPWVTLGVVALVAAAFYAYLRQRGTLP